MKKIILLSLFFTLYLSIRVFALENEPHDSVYIAEISLVENSTKNYRIFERDMIEKIGQLPEVGGKYEKNQTVLYNNSLNFFGKIKNELDLINLYSNTAFEDLYLERGLILLKEGRWLDSDEFLESTPNIIPAVISEEMAELYNFKIGMTFKLFDLRIFFPIGEDIKNYDEDKLNNWKFEENIRAWREYEFQVIGIYKFDFIEENTEYLGKAMFLSNSVVDEIVLEQVRNSYNYYDSIYENQAWWEGVEQDYLEHLNPEVVLHQPIFILKNDADIDEFTRKANKILAPDYEVIISEI